VEMLWRKTLKGKGGRRWRGRNHPKKKKIIIANDEWQRRDGAIQMRKNK
jgi:hypothetical protein